MMKIVVKVILNQWAVGSGQWAVRQAEFMTMAV